MRNQQTVEWRPNRTLGLQSKSTDFIRVPFLYRRELWAVFFYVFSLLFAQEMQESCRLYLDVISACRCLLEKLYLLRVTPQPIKAARRQVPTAEQPLDAIRSVENNVEFRSARRARKERLDVLFRRHVYTPSCRELSRQIPSHLNFSISIALVL